MFEKVMELGIKDLYYKGEQNYLKPRPKITKEDLEAKARKTKE
jgi:hypothetical protein